MFKSQNLYTGAMGILTKKAEPIQFNVSAAVFVMEAIKFVLALCGIVRSGNASFTFEAKDTVILGLVATLYGVWNNLRFYILEIIDPATLFLIHNVKIVFTAVFLRVLTGKRLKCKQWISLVVLTLGVAVVMIHRDERVENKSNTPLSSSKSIVFFGCILALVRGVGTALTNVLCEYVYKRREKGFWYLNAELYLFGMIVNFISVLSVKDENSSSNIFHDMFSLLPILIILLGGFSGMCVSFIFKFIDNIALIAADVIALVMLVFISAAYFGLSINAPLILGCLLIVTSLGYYYTSGEDDTQSFSSSSNSSSTAVVEIPMTPPTTQQQQRSSNIEVEPS